MKKYILIGLLALGCALQASAGAPLDKAERDKVAETLGHLIVRHLVNPGFELDVDRIVAGIQDAKLGKAAPMTEEEYEQAIYTIQEYMFNKDAEKNLGAANAFLEQNKREPGVMEVDAQLQYRVDKAGNGAIVEANSIPMIRYEGKLIDGTVFASCIGEEDEAISLAMEQTIPGFAKGLVGMQEGERRTLYIHPELAYGVGGHLPPNSLLIFDVELVKAHQAPPQESVADLGTTVLDQS